MEIGKLATLRVARLFYTVQYIVVTIYLPSVDIMISTECGIVEYIRVQEMLRMTLYKEVSRKDAETTLKLCAKDKSVLGMQCTGTDKETVQKGSDSYRVCQSKYVLEIFQQ